MKPIRNEVKTQIAHEPWQQDRQHPTDQEDVAHVLTDEGAIASQCQVHRQACVCGCLRAPGGFCAACRGLVCVECFGLCDYCRMPLCGRHSVFPQRQEDGFTRLCHTCARSLRSRRRTLRLVKALLSPLIRFEE